MQQLRKKSRRGFRGYPLATIALYGPTDQIATKVAVGIILADGADADELERWTVGRGDIRQDATIEMEIVQMLLRRGVRTVVMSPGIIGCPHEEGIDYPDGEACPTCPFWKGRDRWAGVDGV
ncbi:MAG: hypothetical protein KDC98_09235 [Planctomycetes bacterium]|nr:hypothetical protein [Planctomycetota bacterium]